MYGSQKITILFVIAGLCLGISADVDCEKRPERMDPRTCCAIPDVIPEEIKEKCKSQSTTSGESNIDESSDSSKPHSRPHPHPHCFMECVAKETGIFVNNELNAAALNDYLKKALEDDAPDMITIAEEAFTTCAAKAKEFKSKMEERMKNNPPATPSDKMRRPHCASGAGFVIGCAMGKMFKDCPAAYWNDSPQCNEHREYFKSCPMSKMGKHHGPPRNSAEKDEQ